MHTMSIALILRVARTIHCMHMHMHVHMHVRMHMHMHMHMHMTIA